MPQLVSVQKGPCVDAITLAGERRVSGPVESCKEPVIAFRHT
jgi:hypothetical protein